MASGTGNLPNQNMDFTPFDILTAEEMDDLVENIESLADGSGIGDGAIGTSALGQGVVTAEILGGTRVATGEISPTGTGDFSVTGLGFTPTLVEFRGSFTSPSTGATEVSSIMTGAMTATSQNVVYFAGRNSTTHGAHSGSSDSLCVQILTVSTAGVASGFWTASRVSLDADGFTLNFSARAGTTARLFYTAYR